MAMLGKAQNGMNSTREQSGPSRLLGVSGNAAPQWCRLLRSFLFVYLQTSQCTKVPVLPHRVPAYCIPTIGHSVSLMASFVVFNQYIKKSA